MTPAIVHRCKPSLWGPILSHDCTDSPVLAALQHNAERSILGLADKAELIQTSMSTRKDTLDGIGIDIMPSQDATHRHEQNLGSLHFPQADEPITLCALDSNSSREVSRMVTLLNPDTTLVDDPIMGSKDSLEDGMSIQSHTVYSTGRNQTQTPNVFSSHKCALAHMQRQNPRYCRHSSSNSAFGTVGVASVPLRSRSKTNAGLLSFKASPFKDHMNKPVRGFHRRKISLNLPVKAQVIQPEVSPRSKLPDLNSCAVLPHRLQTAPKTAMVNTLTPEERDLEYKHHHTYIGTGSLDDFLELLEVSDIHLTTQNAVVKAFLQLSSTEQTYARQFSPEPDGWELVSRVKLDVMDVTSIDYIVQLQVKLGSIKLRKLLEMIPFDENKQATVMQVVEAFSAASHMDATTTMGIRSKARDFRSWIIAQKARTEY